jgi:hypothetical protein
MLKTYYRLPIMNAAEKRQHFEITAEGMYELKVLTGSGRLDTSSPLSARRVSCAVCKFLMIQQCQVPIPFASPLRSSDDADVCKKS